MQKVYFFPQHHGVDLQDSSSTPAALEIIPFAEHFIQQKNANVLYSHKGHT